MEGSVQRFQDFIDRYSTNETQKLLEYIKKYKFLYGDKKTILNNPQILQNLSDSRIILIKPYIDKNKTAEQQSHILSFEKTILVVDDLSAVFLNELLVVNPGLSFIFLTNSNNIINFTDNKNYNEIIPHQEFDEEIGNFKNSLRISFQNNESSIKEFYINIQPCIAGYLIEKSYLKRDRDRIDDFYMNSTKDESMENLSEKDYIQLRKIDSGSSFSVFLNYHIEKNELFAIKKLDDYQNQEKGKLIKRVSKNCQNLNHPFLSKFYGKIKNTDYFAVEFIHGKQLDQVNFNNYTDDEIYSIMLELILSIQYIHKNHFIIRDLKPDNIMIDQNRNAIIIDFDRMVNYDDIQHNNVTHTNTFPNSSAPEVNLGQFSYECDVYSLGYIMKFIIKKKLQGNKMSDRYSLIKKIYKQCESIQIENRPSVSKLIEIFYQNFISTISKTKKGMKLLTHSMREINSQRCINYLYLLYEANTNDPVVQYNLGQIYNEGKIVPRDFNKSLFYYTLAANQNHVKAQFKLAQIYFLGKYLLKDISKAIYYLELAADNNCLDSQTVLATIYYYGEYIPRDINKAIYYNTAAANQNDVRSQFNLGLIYSNGQFVERDIDKAIYYYTLASNQNDADSQKNLATIYYEGIYVKQDINKAIHYLNLAANNNQSQAQYNLGIIYYYGEYVKKNIDKAIMYFTKAANNYYPEAQYSLGFIYYEGKYVKRNIEKAIYYYSLAANQDNMMAQYNLGLLYYEGEYVKKDYYKSLSMLELAANKNIPQAQFLIGNIYYRGWENISRNIPKSIYYYSLAANQNHRNAQHKLCVIYSSIEFISHDVNKSIYYLTLAADNNDLFALYKLGMIYYNGLYIKKDINKSIRFLTLAADQNYPKAQYKLGIINYEGIDVIRDIHKSIHYLTLAANQNYLDASFSLGSIYYNGQYIKRDIEKCIYYYTLCANKNMPNALNNLGIIYFTGIYVPQDINKAIHYLKLAANQNYSEAQYNLACVYWSTDYCEKKFKKILYYYTLTANKNNHKAQLHLSFFYLNGVYTKKDIQKGLNYLVQSSDGGNLLANFNLGYIYHEGKYIEQDIDKCIRLYKEASSLDLQYAKNNLGVIYKIGFGDKVQPNPSNAEIYFNEAINQRNDVLSLYNLAHTYVYDFGNDEKIEKSIDLLVRAIKQNFEPSYTLLCLIMVKKFGDDFHGMMEKLMENGDKNKKIFNKVLVKILGYEIDKNKVFDRLYEQTKNIYFLYDNAIHYISSIEFSSHKANLNQNTNSDIPNINDSFYEGFGF